MSRTLANNIFPVRHGEFGNSVSELYYFSLPSMVAAVPSRPGGSIDTYATNQLAYTGHGLIGLWNGSRRASSYEPCCSAVRVMCLCCAGRKTGLFAGQHDRWDGFIALSVPQPRQRPTHPRPVEFGPVQTRRCAARARNAKIKPLFGCVP